MRNRRKRRERRKGKMKMMRMMIKKVSRKTETGRGPSFDNFVVLFSSLSFQ